MKRTTTMQQRLFCYATLVICQSVESMRLDDVEEMIADVQKDIALHTASFEHVQGKLARTSEEESRAKALHEQQCAVDRAALLAEGSRSIGRTRLKLKSKEEEAIKGQALRVE
eukprot:1407273-Pleurochrysis_carterae.AAC.1